MSVTNITKITGVEFNEKYTDTFYAVMRSANHSNTVIDRNNRYTKSIPISFATIEFLPRMIEDTALRYDIDKGYIAKVTVLEDSEVTEHHGYFFTRRLFVDEFIPIDEFVIPDTYVERILEINAMYPHNGYMALLFMVETQSYELCERCVNGIVYDRHNINTKDDVVKYIDDEFLDEAMFANAVKHGCSLKSITDDNRTREMIHDAIHNNGVEIRYINNPSDELCKKAILRDPHAIQFIKNPTEEMCIIAVENNPHVIQFINNPSETVRNKVVGTHAEHYLEDKGYCVIS
jgi:hypothetical protein